MKILILGGGVFLGAAVLRSALDRGHELTVFNRGRACSAWPEGVEAIVGDRATDLGQLDGRKFDAVVDTCGYAPADVQKSAQALRDSAIYCFVSSISAYASFAHAPVREADRLADFKAIDPSDRDIAHYGPQKAACEAEVGKVFGERGLIVRPGLIVGPGDRSGRFSHWPWRAMEGGEMLVPDLGDDEPLQFIDVRDLGAWIVRLLERGERGAFNATGPANGPTWSWADLVAACQDEAAERGAPELQVTPVAESFLLEHKVEPWSELPLWLASQDAENHAHSRVEIQRAERTRLTTRPLEQTVAAVMDEGVPAPDDARRRGKLTRTREAELLALWHEQPAADEAP
ncbi:MAG: NAD-dependent epimerase/dehydratase family protein [Caldimonas sp.]